MTTAGRIIAGPSHPLASSLSHVGSCASVVLGVIGGYTLLALPIAAWITSPVVATMTVGGIVVVAVGCVRLLRPQLVSYRPAPLPPGDARRQRGFWRWATLATALAFLAGQTNALMLYGLIGSADFDRHLDVEQASATALLVALTLVAAPLSEETLFRGLAYPLLRRRTNIVAATLITTLVFACMHGNLVQAAATVPLGIVLALVAERTRGLWQVVIVHVAYNLAAMLVPPQAIHALATPHYVVPLAAAWTVCLGPLFVRARSTGAAVVPG
jgi:membrane protease YdiL (CAAX protease family)